MRISRLFVAAIAGASIACGGGGGGGGVTNPPPPVKTLDRVTVSPSTLSLNAGQGQALTASGVASDGSAITTTFTYTSSNTTIATVSAAGRVLALSAGTATITVTGTAGSVSRQATVNLTVSGALPNAVTVEAGAQSNDFTPRDIAILKGGTVTWTFPGIVHNVNFQGQAGAPANIGDTGNNSSGISRTFANSGNFSYVCSLHSGMAGSVLVP